MQIQTANDLIRALRDGGVLPAAQADTLAAELAPLGDDPPALMRHVIKTERVTLFQLRKVLHGKADELTIGPYRVTDKLGEGGMGKVYRATETHTGRVVALKVIRPSLLSNPIVRGRYEREVKAASRLRHPNVVGVVDAGDTDGRVYLAMEFVDGIDLARLVREYGLLTVPEACEYVRQAALGLHHAHEMGFVHRDIKPSNIVVSGERHIPDATGPAEVKILDMGLVKAVGLDDGDGGTDLTRAGTVVGTPDYMAPEQAKHSKKTDHRADQYALGCTFYYLLTGRPPYPDGSPIEKILKHQADPPPPLQAVRPDVPDALAEIVARLMAKKPDDRFPSARDLAAALEPLTHYTADDALIVTPRPPRTDGAAGGPPASPSTLAPLFTPSASDELAPRTPVPPKSRPQSTLNVLPPVETPKDSTPRPADRPRPKKRLAAVSEPDSEFDVAPRSRWSWVLVAAAVAGFVALAAAVAVVVGRAG
jgi:serine/threonine-protein kinase